MALQAKQKKVRFGAVSVGYTVVVLAILVGLNWLANRYNKSLDMTEEQRFSLSEQTTKIVQGLKDPVTIYYFGSKTSGYNAAKDVLTPYDSLSDKVSVKYVDMEEDPFTAKRFGVQTSNTAVLTAGERSEEARGIGEEEITGALVRLTKGKAKPVCIQQGFGENNVEDEGQAQGIGVMKRLLEGSNYEARPVSLLNAATVPAECGVLIVPGSRQDVPQPAVDSIKVYVEQGGRVLLMLGAPVQIKGDAVSNNEALLGLIASWGVTLNKNLIIDASSAGRAAGFSPLTPAVTSYEFHPITRPFKGRPYLLISPLTRSLTLQQGKALPLYATSKNSVATTELASNEIDPRNAKETGPFVVAAAGTLALADKKEGRFVVTGSADWVRNDIPPSLANFNMFTNMVNWLAQDEDLISIRPKDAKDRRLNMTVEQTNLVFFSSVIFLPVMAVLAGVSAWWRRR